MCLSVCVCVRAHFYRRNKLWAPTEFNYGDGDIRPTYVENQDSDIDRRQTFLSDGFRDFLQSLKRNARTVTQISPRLLISTSFPIKYLLPFHLSYANHQ
jgi:hypothetical protein